MEPASEKPPCLSFDADALGRPQTWTVHHRGLEYRGEVIVAEAPLREYNRRLGSHSVQQVLAQPSREQLDRYIDLLRVADPSALATVLDDEVVAFLRQFLARD